MTAPSDSPIFLMKLTVGDMVLGKLVEETPTHYVIEKPYFLVQDQEGKIAVAKYLPVFLETTLPFNKLSIDVHGTANQSLQNLYTEALTGIKIPQKTNYNELAWHTA